MNFQAASLTEKETQEALRILEEDSNICTKSSKVDPKLVADAYKGIFVDDEKLKEYLLCFSKRQDFLDENGLLQKHIMFKRLYMDLLDAELAEKITDKCLVNFDTPQNTAFEVTKCYYLNNPKCCFGL